MSALAELANRPRLRIEKLEFDETQTDIIGSALRARLAN